MLPRTNTQSSPIVQVRKLGNPQILETESGSCHSWTQLLLKGWGKAGLWGTESSSPGALPHLLEVSLQLGVSFLGLPQLAVSSAQLLLQLAHLTAQHRQALPQLAHLGTLPFQGLLQLCCAPVGFSNRTQAIGKGLEREKKE